MELRDQLSDATKQINAMSAEYVSIKENAGHQNELITTLQTENERLRSRIEEYLQELKKRDRTLEEYANEVWNLQVLERFKLLLVSF